MILNNKFNSSKLIELYVIMKRIRTFEERVSELFIRGHSSGSMLHLSVGEELGAACVGNAMQDSDSFTTHHRGHGIFLARKGDPNRMMAEIAGKKDGYCKGKGGSMHIADMNLGHLGSNAIVGGGIPTVIGAGLSYKFQSLPNISVAFFGDGAMQQGILYESMNMAVLWGLPVVFCCINNQYGMGTKIDEAVGLKNFSGRAKSFGLNTLHIKTLDVEEAFYQVKSVLDKTRKNEPSFIEIDCYRFLGHARMDKSPYRSEKEEKKGRAKDPIVFSRNKIISNQLLNENNINEIDTQISAEMDKAIEFAIQSPINDEVELYTDIFEDEESKPEQVQDKINRILSI